MATAYPLNYRCVMAIAPASKTASALSTTRRDTKPVLLLPLEAGYFLSQPGRRNFEALNAPLLLRPQPFEALDKLANWRRLDRSRKTRREAYSPHIMASSPPG